MALHHDLATFTLGRLQPLPPASGFEVCNRPGMSRSSGDLLLALGLGFCDTLEIAAILHLVSGICGFVAWFILTNQDTGVQEGTPAFPK